MCLLSVAKVVLRATPTDTAVAQKFTIILGMCFVSDKKLLPTQTHSDVTNYLYERHIYNNLA